MEDTWEEKEEEIERQIMRERERKRPSKYFYRGERTMLAGRRVTQKEERGRGRTGRGREAERKRKKGRTRGREGKMGGEEEGERGNCAGKRV